MICKKSFWLKKILFTFIRLISHLILGLITTPVDNVTTHSMLQGLEESNYTWTILKVVTINTITIVAPPSMIEHVLLTREITSIGTLEFRPPVIVRSTCMVEHIIITHILIRQTFFIFTGLPIPIRVISRKDLRAMLKEKGRDQIW